MLVPPSGFLSPKQSHKIVLNVCYLCYRASEFVLLSITVTKGNQFILQGGERES